MALSDGSFGRAVIVCQEDHEVTEVVTFEATKTNLYTRRIDEAFWVKSVKWVGGVWQSFEEILPEDPRYDTLNMLAARALLIEGREVVEDGGGAGGYPVIDREPPSLAG